MNYLRLTLAALVGLFVYFAFGFIVFGLLLSGSYREYPALFRSAESIQRLFPLGIAATFVAILVVAVLYAGIYRDGSALAQGTRLGALIGLFSVCGFVIHNYVNLNIGLKLTIEQAIAYFIEWTIVGIAVSLIYKPAAKNTR